MQRTCPVCIHMHLCKIREKLFDYVQCFSYENKRETEGSDFPSKLYIISAEYCRHFEGRKEGNCE